MIQQESKDKNWSQVIETQEMHLEFDNLAGQSVVQDSEATIRYGVISYYTDTTAFINYEYINKRYNDNYVVDKKQSVIFNPRRAKIEFDGKTIKTPENVYIVRFVTKGYVKNSKTNEEQPALCYEHPIEVLYFIPSRACVRIVLEGFSARIFKSVTSSGKAKVAKELSSIDNEQKKRIADLLLRELSRTGYYVAAKFPELLKEVDITNYHDYAPTIEQFLDAYFSGTFVYKRNVEINEKKYPGLIVMPNWQASTKLSPEAITNIQHLLSNALTKDGYILASSFPVLLRQVGIYNFRNHANTIEEFLSLYLQSFELRKNVYINGKKYPGIIVETGKTAEGIELNSDSVSEENSNIVIDAIEKALPVAMKEQDYTGLDALYEEGKYYEYLSSALLADTIPNQLPWSNLEKALNCAAQLLNPGSDEIHLNEFQKEIIRIPTGRDFVRKWKGSAGYPTDLMQLCGVSSMGRYDVKTDSSRIVKQLNRLGFSTALNNNYVGLCERFVACENELIPHFFVIRICTQKGKKTALRVISEYCQVVKNLKQDIPGGKISNDIILASFDKLLCIIKKYFLQEDELPQNIRTNIYSTFLDTNSVEKLEEIIDYLIPDHTTNERQLLKLVTSPENWTEDLCVTLLKNNVSLQALQKSLAYVWETHKLQSTVPLYFLRVLSWILKYDSYTTIDEILRHHPTGDFTKIQKQNALLASINCVYTESTSDFNMYTLATYIYQYIYKDAKNVELLDTTKAALDSWSQYSESFYLKRIAELGELNEKSIDRFVKLFGIFKLDLPHYAMLQKQHAEWFRSHGSYNKLSEKETKELLDKLFNDAAYETYVQLFDSCSITDYDKIEQYASSMINLHRYSELIAYLLQNAYITQTQREMLLTKTISENFREYALSPRAYSIFAEGYSYVDAISMLQENIKQNKPYVISSLIALYSYTKEFAKAIYLYQIFRGKSESGFTRLYSQFRSLLNKYQLTTYTNNDQDHYDVIKLAFHSLSPNELLEFFSWAKKVTIPDSKAYRSSHVLAYYYNTLIEEPYSKTNWEMFLSHLSKKSDMNTWYIIVCKQILKERFGCVSLNSSSSDFVSVIQGDQYDKTPLNYLYYAFAHIIEHPNSDLVNTITTYLQDSDWRSRVVDKNPWYVIYKPIVDEFKAFSMVQYSQTKESCYYDVLTALGLTLDTSDMKQLSEEDVDKQYLFVTICKNYLHGQHITEMNNLLISAKWNHLSDTEQKMLSLLKLIYGDNAELISENPILFADEDVVNRFKRDCASILCEYPTKAGLFSFDSECNNLSHKLIVYSYVFNVFYDEDIYDKYWKPFTQFQGQREYMAYLSFLDTTYNVQLTYNASYDFLYKRFRYLKLYANLVLRKGIDIDDSHIISIMKKNKHYDDVYVAFYKPFRDQIKQYWDSDGLDESIKSCFLYGIMTGNMADLFTSYGDDLLKASEHQQLQMTRMISLLDYRCANQDFFRHYLPAIEQGEYDDALIAAKSISQFAYETVDSLKKHQESTECISLFKELMKFEKPQQKVPRIFNLDEKVFQPYSDMLIPLLCASQFTFRIFGGWRQQIIKGRKKDVAQRQEQIASYLYIHGEHSAQNVCNYLLALLACIQRKPRQAAAIVSRCDITHNIPQQWKTEADRIKAYANGSIYKFMPDNDADDSSKATPAKELDATFVEMLQSISGDSTDGNEQENVFNCYQRYLSVPKGTWEKLQIGVKLLRKALVESNSDAEVYPADLPSFLDLSLQVGLEAVDSANNVAIDQQMAIVAALFSARTKFKKAENDQNLSKLIYKFADLLTKKLSISTWVKYADVIEDYLNETSSALGFTQIRLELLKPYEPCLVPWYSQEDKYMKLQKLHTSAGEMEELSSVYAKYILEAIRKEMRQIEEGYRAKIDIISGNFETTDGYVYFQITNIGKRTISFNNGEFRVYRGDFEIPIESITDLRSGYVTGGRTKISFKDGKTKTKVSLKIVHTLKNGTQVTLSNTSKEITLINETVQMKVRYPKPNGYSVDRAVIKEEMLHGRDHEKNLLRACIPDGVTVIYGPSRIGKTSLLNWVRINHAADTGNVMTILYGGEAGRGKEKDYQHNFANKNLDIPYADDAAMSEYLLSKSIVHGLNNRLRFTKPANHPVPVGLYNDIIEILNDPDPTMLLVERYYAVDKLLRDNNLQLWLMLDEFQQVVEKWKNIDSGCEFSMICDLLTSQEENVRLTNIKLIVCGSDDLLKHMVLDHTSAWKLIFQRASTITVEPLHDGPFKKMIETDPALNGSNVHFSDQATLALYNYTNGVALYGKEICNAILEDISTRPEAYKNRTVLYVSDVAWATQKLLNRQNYELTTQAREGISEIYRAVTNNLGSKAMNYLWYMAQWLDANPEYDGFKETIFTSRGLIHSIEDLHDALEIAKARGIITVKSDDAKDEHCYVFQTLFYFFAFAGSAPRIDILEKQIFLDEDSDSDASMSKDAYEALVDHFKTIPHKPTAMKRLYYELEADDKKVYDEDTIRTLQIGDNVGGNKIGEQHIQINIQQITNAMQAFNAGTLTGQELFSCVKELPKLSTYYVPNPELERSNPALEAQRLEHGISAIADLYTDSASAVIDSDIDTSISDYEKYHVDELLMIKEPKFDKLCDTLDDWAYEHLRLTLYLHYFFNQAQVENQGAEYIDYSPVSIMYCKLFESLLKEKHRKIYARVFRDVLSNVTQRDKKTKKQKTLTYYELMTGKQQHRITIGTFSYLLKNKENCEKLGEECRDDDNEPTTEIWKKHAIVANEILEIRNVSAHGQKDHRISSAQQDKLTYLLFKDDGGALERVSLLASY